MKKLLLLLFLGAMTTLGAQEVIIFDFETPETSTSYRYFGGSIDGDTARIIDNPNPSGVNTSSKVIQYVKPAASQPWAGAYADPAPANPIDLRNGGQLCADIHFNHIGNIGIKVETSPDDGWIQTGVNTEVNTWQTICVDVSDPSLDPPMMPTEDKFYTQLVIFPDFQTVLEANDTFYIDNLKYIPGVAMASSLYDFEGDNPGVFTYFASSLDGTNVPVIDNPNATGVNETSKVLAFTRAAGSEVFAGAFGNPGLEVPIDVMQGNNICVDVHFDHVGNFTIKLEGSATDADGWTSQKANTVIGEWETICYSLDSMPVEGEMFPATGNVYSRLTIFPDFLTPSGAEDVTTYIDNITYDGKFVEVVVVEKSNITFRVDASGLDVAAEGMFLAGDSINNWTAAETPMTDDDEDGIWEVSMDLNPGPVQYKFVNGSTFEELVEGDCTITSDGFTNRALEVGENDQILPIYIFGTCDSPTPGMSRVLYDWETEETSTFFRYFGSSAEGDTTPVIANPDPSGVNDSPTVIQFVKPAEAMTWAGAAASPAPTVPMDFTNGGEVCVDVWFDHIGSLSVKLEASTTGGSNWITTVANTEINTWQTLCFDVSEASIEDPFLPAIGNAFGQIVLFTDFGVAPTEDVTSYIDNVVLNTFGAEVELYNVTFNVDMTNETVGDDGVFLTGDPINNWQANTIPMLDDDGDNIYTATVALPDGVVQYKFVNSGVYEEFSVEGDCNITTTDGNFINRLLLLEERDTTVQAYFFNSCELSTDVKDIAFNEELFEVIPTVTSDFVTLSWENNSARNITIVNSNGQLMTSVKTQPFENERMINVSDFASGIYFVKMDTATSFGIRKMIVE